MIRGARAAMIAALVLCAGAARAEPGGVIPLPANVVTAPGAFPLSAGTVLQAPQGRRASLEAARYLAYLWKRSNALNLAVSARAGNATGSSIAFRLAPGFGPEAYRLHGAPDTNNAIG